MSYFCHSSSGRLISSGQWWLILRCDPGIIDFYEWLTTRWGVALVKGSREGAHISVVRGDTPAAVGVWSKVLHKHYNFKYTNIVRHNGEHAWLDVYSPELNEVRGRLGLYRKKNHTFHLTLGRLKYGPRND